MSKSLVSDTLQSGQKDCEFWDVEAETFFYISYWFSWNILLYNLIHIWWVWNSIWNMSHQGGIATEPCGFRGGQLCWTRGDEERPREEVRFYTSSYIGRARGQEEIRGNLGWGTARENPWLGGPAVKVTASPLAGVWVVEESGWSVWKAPGEIHNRGIRLTSFDPPNQSPHPHKQDSHPWHILTKKKSLRSI